MVQRVEAGQFVQFVGKLELTIDLDAAAVLVPHGHGGGWYNGAALEWRVQSSRVFEGVIHARPLVRHHVE